jgi:phosphonate transport system ATP-binding protein
MRIQTHAIDAIHPTARPGAPLALTGFDLEIAAGEQLAVIGPSGSGKTTLLYVLACSIKPTSGRLSLNQIDPWSLSKTALKALRGSLFLAPQMPPLPPRQRVVTAVLAGKLAKQSLAGSLRSLFYPSDIPGAFEALEKFDISEKIFERVDRLSGGERQRVGLARALLARPALWLIDEPLSALDPKRAEQALQTLTQAATDNQGTLVCTLHHVEMALKHFPRIVGLRDGRLMFDLPAAEVTREQLFKLYANHEDELTGPASLDEDPSLDSFLPPPQPAVMHCR